MPLNFPRIRGVGTSPRFPRITSGSQKSKRTVNLPELIFIDNTPPFVANQFPLPGATGVATDGYVFFLIDDGDSGSGVVQSSINVVIDGYQAVLNGVIQDGYDGYITPTGIFLTGFNVQVNPDGFFPASSIISVDIDGYDLFNNIMPTVSYSFTTA